MSGVPVYSPGEAGRFRVALDQIVPSILGNPVVLTSDGSIDPGTGVVEVDASAGPVTVTLPTLAVAYKPVLVVKTDASANAVTIDGFGSETIAGAANATLSSQWDTADVRPASSGWMRA